ncbi:MAG TPA: hypothetical protein VMP00_15505 [Burkholderiales bacterium]|nr:hypothetical protein [Burkholderiales bacterium]
MRILPYSPSAEFSEKRLTNSAAPEPTQKALGLLVSYPLQLRPNIERARTVRTRLPAEIAAHLASLNVYDARGIGFVTDFSVYRYVFHPGASLNLDEIVEGSAKHLVNLDGVRNPRCAIRTLTVSGLDARRIGFSAERWEQRFGVEELGIFYPAGRTLWTVQATYAEKPRVHRLAAFALFMTRRHVSSILGSIRVAAAQ